MYFKQIIFFLTGIVLSVVFIEGCSNKGCTDKTAINYSVVANKDDHSCEFCDSTLVMQGSVTALLMDNNSLGGHFNQNVAKFILVQNSWVFNDNKCGDSKCFFTYTIQNLTTQDFDLNYTLAGFGNVSFSVSNTVSIPASQTINIDAIPDSLVFNACGFFNSAGVSANSTIIYH